MSVPIKNTVLFLIKDDQILLGMKKRGFGAGWWNGFGGKLDPGETFDQSVIRETREECTLEIHSLQTVARLLFYFDGQLEIACQAYITRDFSGKPQETEEMRPQWFKLDAIPYDTMWPGDDQWIPQVIASDGSTILDMAIYFNSDNQFESALALSPEDTASFFTEA